MAGGRRRRSAAAAEEKLGKTENVEDAATVSDSAESEMERARMRLRDRWELASVLNFLNVFEPVIGSNIKMSAEDIETGLIKPDSSLARIHIDLLKGIPPVSKMLNGSDAWVTVLCKKLSMWWPWVAEGEIPLVAAKGQEINRYKELDPTTRLQILKALCEIRAVQKDIASYINDAIKHGTELSCFRKNNIGGDRHGTTYWYDGNTVLGHRLYKGVNKSDPKAKVKGKGCLAPPVSSFKWETLATNLEEFRKVADDFSSSKVIAQVAVGKTVQTDAIPVLENLQKKKEMARKRKKRQEMLLNDSQNSFIAESTRSCRNRRPVSYTFDEYDRTINEAIQLTNKRKATEDQRCNVSPGSMNAIPSDGDSDADTDSDNQLRDSSVNSQNSMESGSSDLKPDEDGTDYDDNKSDEYNIRKEDENDGIGNDEKTAYINSNDDGDDDEDGDNGKSDRPAGSYMKMEEGDECNIKKEEGSEDGNDCQDEKTFQNHMEVENDDGGDDSKANRPAESNMKMEEGDECNIKKEEGSEDDWDSKDEKAYQDHMEVESDNGGDLSNSQKKIVDPSNRHNTTTRTKGQSCLSDYKPSGLHWSIRLTEMSSHSVAGTRSPGMKNRLRQRPTRNTAMESIVIPDSEGECLTRNRSTDIPEGKTSSPTADVEEDESDC